MDQARNAALEVLERFEPLWGAPLDELFLASEVQASSLYHFTWTQWRDGYEVAGARVSLQVRADGIAAMGTTAVQLPDDFDSIPRIGPDVARAIVERGRELIPGDDILVSVPLIHVTYGPDRPRARLSYLVDVLGHSKQVYERVYIDALDGTELAVEPGIVHATDVHGSVSGKANTGVGAQNPPQYAGLGFVTVDIPGAGTADSDSLGQYQFTTPLPGPFLVDASLAGPHYDIDDYGGNDAVPLKFTTFQGGVQETLIQFNDTPTEFETSQVTAALLHNRSRAYALSRIAGFSPVANQNVRVNTFVPGYCAAFYLPATKGMTFTQAGGGMPELCVLLALRARVRALHRRRVLRSVDSRTHGSPGGHVLHVRYRATAVGQGLYGARQFRQDREHLQGLARHPDNRSAPRRRAVHGLCLAGAPSIDSRARLRCGDPGCRVHLLGGVLHHHGELSRRNHAGLRQRR
jgi:hypothetical protein